jgi:hypothetical protein
MEYSLRSQHPKQRQLLTKFPTNPEVLKRMERAFSLAGRTEMVRQTREAMNETVG